MKLLTNADRRSIFIKAFRCYATTQSSEYAREIARKAESALGYDVYAAEGVVQDAIDLVCSMTREFLRSAQEKAPEYADKYVSHFREHLTR